MSVVVVEGELGGHHFAGDEAFFGGGFVDDVEGCGDVVGGVDDDGYHGHAAGELKQLVTMRGMITVEAPDAVTKQFISKSRLAG